MSMQTTPQIPIYVYIYTYMYIILYIYIIYNIYIQKKHSLCIMRQWYCYDWENIHVFQRGIHLRSAATRGW